MENHETKTFDLNELKKISGGDEKFVTEMIGVFISTTEEGLSEIEKALEKKNFQGMAGQAHKIAAPCLHMGATNLHGLLKQIETGAGSAGQNGNSVTNLETLVRNARQISNTLINDLKAELDKKK